MRKHLEEFAWVILRKCISSKDVDKKHKLVLNPWKDAQSHTQHKCNIISNFPPNKWLKILAPSLLTRLWENMSFYTLLVEECDLEMLIKLQMHIPLDSASLLVEIPQQIHCTHLRWHTQSYLLQPCVEGKKLETPQMSISRRLPKWWYTHPMEYMALKINEDAFFMCSNKTSKIYCLVKKARCRTEHTVCPYLCKEKKKKSK